MGFKEYERNMSFLDYELRKTMGTSRTQRFRVSYNASCEFIVQGGDFVEWLKSWCRGTELNRRHGDFQSPALPTELPRH